MARVHPGREEGVEIARARIAQGHDAAEIIRDLAKRFQAATRTVTRWVDAAALERAAQQPRELEDERRRALLALQDKAGKLWRVGFECIGGEAQLENGGVPEMDMARKGAYAANQYFSRALQCAAEQARLSHWYLIPPERDLDVPEVRQLVATMISSNAEAFELSLLNDMVAALSKVRDERLAQSSVVDLAAVREEREGVL
jgi:hypothetical protein